MDVEDTLDGTPIIDLLLEPTRIYVKSVLAVLEQIEVKAMSHITGGGFIENIPRAFPEDVRIDIDASKIAVPKIIDWLITLGEMDRNEAYNVFNMGIGFILCVAQDDVNRTLAILEEAGESPLVIGEVTDGNGLTIHGY